MTKHIPPKAIPKTEASPVSEITAPAKPLYDFKQAIETIIMFIDLDLNDDKVEEHIKQDLRVLRTIITAVNLNYPFTENSNNQDAMERKFRRQQALSNITGQMASISVDNAYGKFDQPRT